MAVSFARSADGTRIAWSQTGSGPPLVRAGMFMTHVEFEARNAVWGHWMRDLSRHFTYIRYDERGCGLSERKPPSIGEGDWIADLDAVVAATGHPRVAVFGLSHGAALAVAYAALRPERVSHLVLLGGYAAGGMAEGMPPERADRTRTMADMKRLFWTDPDPGYHRMWTMRLVPDGTATDMAALDDMQRASSSGDMAAAIMLARDVMDVRDRAKTLRIPTLVAHARHDLIVDYAHGVELAALVPEATLLTLDTRNHLLLDEPAWDEFVAAAADLIGGPQRPVQLKEQPTSRELDVLELVAGGASNGAIAAELHLSVRTVERHLSNLYRKLGLEGRSARPAAAARLGELRRGAG